MSLLQNSMTAKLLCHERQQLGKLFAYKVTAELFALKKQPTKLVFAHMSLLLCTSSAVCIKERS
jgi:hypothetical protein